VTKGAIANVDALVKKLGLPAAAHEVVAGKPREIIPETVKRIGATLLVLGTHARRGLSRMFMGSVAESILADVAVPALIMHVGSDHIPPDRELEELDRAVIAVDLHEGSDRIAMAGLDLIRALKRPTVRATLLHVAHPHEHGEYRAAVSDSAKDQLEALRARCTSDDLPIDVRVVDGDAAEAIVDVAKEEDAEMIVVGRRAVGGVITQVIRRSPVIVLVVPASD
jgi:nucleotide-binding universal stress UspA family protein